MCGLKLQTTNRQTPMLFKEITNGLVIYKMYSAEVNFDQCLTTMKNCIIAR